MEKRAFGGGGNSGIYRGAKFSFFEGGIRVPAIISCPSKLPQNKERNQMSVNTDWFPTILDLCGINYNSNSFEGKSLEKVIMDNEASSHEVFCWYQKKDYWAIRKGDWKLLRNPKDPSKKGKLTKDDAYFLVNIIEQPDEMTNLASKHPKKVEELKQDFEKWYKKTSNN
jgi:arylsulfatase A-like enzyme